MTGKMTDIGRGAAHVKADQPVIPRRLPGANHADDPARRTGQDGILSLKPRGLGQAAVRLHEQQPAFGPAKIKGTVHARHIAAQDRRQIGVDHRCVAPRHQLGQTADAVTGRNLGKAFLCRKGRHPRLVVGVHMGMQESNCHGPKPAGIGPAQGRAGSRLVQRGNLGPLGVKPPRHLVHSLVQQIGAADVQIEQGGARLRSDPQKIAEPFGDQQQNPFALALQQGIGGNGGAHLDGGYRPRRQLIARTQPQTVANALHGGIRIAIRVFGQQLAGFKRSVRSPRHDIGESTAPVDPEFPRCHACPRCLPLGRAKPPGCQSAASRAISAGRSENRSNSAAWGSAWTGALR